ncbi:hypothetical protein OLX02_03030 [Novosphingobium sp. KCTC 2891]|uniref:hypothetical protein n=1 Tax=Novosphingobium sp. KCTC 2891 TaxID=2989730 RepID=UPI00222179CC|nr:hypothetical protein [Novosphingobium sp. KCTC 2891]MCW1381790.1 hypothetical protein [Novosphingobium sp. KCTC 2891]
MTVMYRFVTPHRYGKWYPDLLTAQRQASAIGAGFFETRTGVFYQYPGTQLETRALEEEDTAARELAA